MSLDLLVPPLHAAVFHGFKSHQHGNMRKMTQRDLCIVPCMPLDVHNLLVPSVAGKAPLISGITSWADSRPKST